MDGNAALRDDAPTPAERLNSIAVILAAGIRRRRRHIDMGAPTGRDIEHQEEPRSCLDTSPAGLVESSRG
jgi:hypothetical protein